MRVHTGLFFRLYESFLGGLRWRSPPGGRGGQKPYQGIDLMGLPRGQYDALAAGGRNAKLRFHYAREQIAAVAG